MVAENKSAWIGTILQSIGGTLIGILLVWIAGNQVKIITSQAVLQRDFVAQSEQLRRFIKQTDTINAEIDEWFEQIWPRLRTHGENVQILKNEVEDICKCSISLNQPEEF